MTTTPKQMTLEQVRNALRGSLSPDYEQMLTWADAIDEVEGISPSFSFLGAMGYSAWELVSREMLGGKLGKIRSVLLGYADYQLKSVKRLEKRDYRVLFFTPASYVFPSTE